MSTIKHRTKVEAAQQGFFKGTREQLIVEELKGNGIPAKVTSHGVGVEHGTLDVYGDEEGYHVFEWTPDTKAAEPPATDEEEATDEEQKFEGGEQPAQHRGSKGKKGK